MKKSFVLLMAIAFATLASPPQAQTTISRVIPVCMSTPIEDCQQGFNVNCRTNINAIAENVCTLRGPSDSKPDFLVQVKSTHSGKECGISRYEIRCMPHAYVDNERNVIKETFCVGGKEQCPTGRNLPCGADLTSHARSFCTSNGGTQLRHFVTPVSTLAGGQCGGNTVEVTCLLE